MLKILINNRTFFIILLLWVVFGALFQLFYTPTQLIFWINQHHNDFLDGFFRFITYCGEDFTWLGLLLFFAFKNFIQGIKKIYEIKLLLITWLAKVLVSVSLKNIFSLPRPIEVYQNSGKTIHLVDGVTLYHWQSFPSGHTMTAFAFACLCLFVLKNNKIAIVSLFLAMLVAYSRMYLFQHFPRDVFAGSVFAIGTTLIIFIICKKRLPQSH